MVITLRNTCNPRLSCHSARAGEFVYQEEDLEVGRNFNERKFIQNQRTLAPDIHWMGGVQERLH